MTNDSSVAEGSRPYVSSTFSSLGSILTVVQANAAPATISGLTPMSTTVGAPTSLGTALAIGVAVRYIGGVTVAPINSSSATVSGSDTATVTYTLTVP